MGQKSGIHSKARIVIKYLADSQEPEKSIAVEDWGRVGAHNPYGEGRD